MTRRLRLGYHYHSPYCLEAGKIRMAAVQGLFLDELAGHSEELLCFLHEALPEEKPFLDYEIQSENIRIIPLGPHGPVLQRVWRSFFSLRVLKKHLSQIDFLLLRGPSPLLPGFASQCGIPCGMLLVGDWTKETERPSQGLIKNSAIKLWIRWNKGGQSRAVAGKLVFTNSVEILREVKQQSADAVLVSTSLVREKDIFIRQDTCLGENVQILYAGRVSTSKGLEDLLSAVSIVRSRGHKVTLHVAGPSEKNDPLESLLPKMLSELNLSDAVFFHGFLARTTKLLELYRSSDIFVMPSRDSEGFPRVIWEAMASGLPVVATRVGSVSEIMTDGKNVLLCEPMNPKDLAEHIVELIMQPDTRRKIIAEGLKTAKEKTLEASVSQIMNEIDRHSLKAPGRNQ